MFQGKIKVQGLLNTSLAIELILSTLEGLSISLSEFSLQFIICLGQSLFLIVHSYRSHQELSLGCGHVAPLLEQTLIIIINN